MIIIKDPVLGKYEMKESYQGVEVFSEGKSVSKSNSLDEALRYIANRLVLDNDTELNLFEYTAKRKETYEAIRQAQETNMKENQDPQTLFQAATNV